MFLGSTARTSTIVVHSPHFVTFELHACIHEIWPALSVYGSPMPLYWSSTMMDVYSVGDVEKYYRNGDLHFTYCKVTWSGSIQGALHSE